MSGSRILVVASDFVDGSPTWGSYGTQRNTTSDSGYNNTNTLQAFGSSAHPAAYACWNWSAEQPTGASHWFLPSKTQLENMFSDDSFSTFAEKIAFLATWSSTESDSQTAWWCTSDGFSGDYDKNDEFYTRACFAY